MSCAAAMMHPLAVIVSCLCHVTEMEYLMSCSPTLMYPAAFIMACLSCHGKGVFAVVFTKPDLFPVAVIVSCCNVSHYRKEVFDYVMCINTFMHPFVFFVLHFVPDSPTH